MTAIPKPRPRLLDKQDRKADLAKRERVENATVKARSGGRCEAWERFAGHFIDGRPNDLRCVRRAVHIHHLISGVGRRNVRESVLAEHKLHLCPRCHQDIHGHVLLHVSTLMAWGPVAEIFERARCR